MQYFPNILTLGNLLCGCIGILYAYQYPPYLSAYCVWAACVFDFLDGYVARSMKTSSPLGKQLDSLADMVSFGVLPAMTMFTWIDAVAPYNYWAYGAFLMAVFSALRLGQFNTNEGQKHFFVGLPSPANALFITGLVFLEPPFSFILSNVFVLLAIVVLFSFLLVMPMKFFSLKFHDFSWKNNKNQLIFIMVSALLMGFGQAEAVPFIILSYIFLSLVERQFSRK